MEIQTPDWVKHAIFYQIFPDRFARSQQNRNQVFQHVTWEDWDAKPTVQGYKGGDLWGIVEKLDYIQNLGVTAIYFTPIFQSACNHRYHTHDYYQIDPILGGNEAFRDLLDAVHKRGMRVVLDGVFNHASRGFFYFNDILENGPYSPWVDWFRIEGWPLAPYVGDQPANYESWVGNRALPVFNHEHPDVAEYILRVAEYWIDFGIDGWRLDVPFEVKTPGFWQKFRSRVKAKNPEAYIVGEVWGNAQEWLDGTQFDGVMNYLFTAPTIAFAAGDRVILDLVLDRSYDPYPALDAAGYAEKIQALLAMYDWQIHLAQLNLLASHDTARLLSIASGDKASVELATLLLMTFPGAPSIYYGDEIGLPGALDPDCRRGFPSESQWDHDLLEYHQQLIALRNALPPLRIGDYRVLYAVGQVYVFARTLGEEVVVVAINVGTEEATADFSLTAADLPPRQLQAKFGKVKPKPATSHPGLELPPRSAGILTGI
jgi:glycosidase